MPRPLRALALTLLLACPLLPSGCAASGQLVFGDPPAIFGGTRVWGKILAFSTDEVVNEANPNGLANMVVFVFDLPLSLALDVVLLPVTIPLELSHEGETQLLDVDFMRTPN
mgnify:FL=1